MKFADFFSNRPVIRLVYVYVMLFYFRIVLLNVVFFIRESNVLLYMMQVKLKFVLWSLAIGRVDQKVVQNRIAPFYILILI